MFQVYHFNVSNTNFLFVDSAWRCFLRKNSHIILSTDTIDHISDGGILECGEAMTE